jgi:serine/threonine protein kinase
LIPGYELIDKIGEGGMGEVFRATQLSLQRTVAIKFFHPEFDAPPAFQRESQLMAALAHPHVVTIHDCGQAEERHYLVMEYVDGSTLRTRMEPGQPWPVAQAISVLEAIAQALAYIHGRGILHLDLKPENVLCTSGGEVKITDFGLATPQVEARTLVDLASARGSPDYCAPEQRHGLPLDQRSDVFSLATLAYELLAGRLPSHVYVPATEDNSLLPPAVNEVLRRGLGRDPDERYGTVEELRADLIRTLCPPPRVGRPLALTSVGVAFVALLAVLILWLAGQPSSDGRPPPPPPILSGLLRPAAFGGENCLVCLSYATGQTDLFLLRPDGGEPIELTHDESEKILPACSPDGQKIAFASDRSGRFEIYVLEVEGGRVEQLTRDCGVNRGPCWSPDGKRIAFSSDRDGNSEIYAMEADGSKQVNLTRHPGYDADPSWSPDGSKIAFTSLRDGDEGYRVFVMDADGKNNHPLFKASNRIGYVWPAWSPDGRQIVCGWLRDNAVEIFVCNADGSGLRQLTRLGGVNTLPAWSPDGKRIAFQHIRDEVELGSIYVMNADGSSPIEVLKAGGSKGIGRPTWKAK